MRVSKRMEISAAHILDLPYESKCNSLHGHNYSFEVSVDGAIDEQGMVMDYAEISKAMKAILVRWDHKLFVPKKKALMIPRSLDGRIIVDYPNVRVECSPDQLAILDGETSTAEVIASNFFSILMALALTNPDQNLSVTVKEGDSTEASFP